MAIYKNKNTISELRIKMLELAMMARCTKPLRGSLANRTIRSFPNLLP